MRLPSPNVCVVEPSPAASCGVAMRDVAARLPLQSHRAPCHVARLALVLRTATVRLVFFSRSMASRSVSLRCCSARASCDRAACHAAVRAPWVSCSGLAVCEHVASAVAPLRDVHMCFATRQLCMLCSQLSARIASLPSRLPSPSVFRGSRPRRRVAAPRATLQRGVACDLTARYGTSRALRASLCFVWVAQSALH